MEDSNPSNLLERLRALLVQKQSKKFYAEKLGITVDEVDELMKELKKQPPEDTENEGFEQTKKVNNEKGTIESTISELDFDPKTVEQLAELHKIDLNKYKISNYWSKLRPNGKFTSSVFATLKSAKDYTPEDFAKFLSTYKPKEIAKIEPKDQKDCAVGVDVELSIYDFHLAKRTINKDDNSIALRKERYIATLSSLISKVYAIYTIDKIVFPISNDFFHSDTYQETTTNGTPLTAIASYDEEYEEGFDLLVNAITILRNYCNHVHVVLVQGNHDRTKGFYLAHALEVYFSKAVDVTFDRDHSITKHIVLGNTFIGYHHGNNCKLQELPLWFSTASNKATRDFGSAKYREIHTGDKHHYMAREIMGVRIQQMPSLSGHDRWHEDGLFSHTLRAALVHIYDKEFGKIGEFEERID